MRKLLASAALAEEQLPDERSTLPDGSWSPRPYSPPIRAGWEQRWTFKPSRQIPKQRDSIGRNTDLRLIFCNHRWIGQGKSAVLVHDVYFDNSRVAEVRPGAHRSDWRWLDRAAQRKIDAANNANRMIGITEITPHTFSRVPPKSPAAWGKAIFAAIGLAVLLVIAASAAHTEERPIAAIGPVLLVDGDTVKINGVTIRLLDIDTPETYRSRCEAELILGLKAKARLRKLIDSGPVAYEPDGHDRYGRTLARVFAGGTDVGDVLLAEGLALPYQPGPEAKQQGLRKWCGSAKRP